MAAFDPKRSSMLQYVALSDNGETDGEDRGEAAGSAYVVSPAAKRSPDSNSSRCSGFRKGSSLGTTTGVISCSRFTISRASSNRPICA